MEPIVFGCNFCFCLINISLSQARFLSFYPRPSGLLLLILPNPCPLFFSCFSLHVWQVGKDPRFDSVRNNKFRFFIFWHIQALWVFMTTLPIHVTNFYRHISQQDPPSWNAVDSIGLAVWGIGFAIEVISDHQKSNFRKQHHGSKEPKWICTGLWA